MSIQSREEASQFGAHGNQRSIIEDKCESDIAQVWSEASNAPNSKHFPDEDPPFFLRRPSSSSATNVAPGLNKVTESQGWNSAFRGNMHGDVDSTIRSIIDDLTIENRLLRARNKRLERRVKYNKEIEKDRLFEVSLYNISASDARELEEILSAFVRDRNVSLASPRPQLSEENVQSSLAKLPDNDAAQNLTLPSLSVSHVAQSGASSNKLDSGYASMSMTPGPGSTSILNNATSGRRKHANPSRAAEHSHLNNVPRGLLPRHVHAATERSKKKMVVQRLEELFTGKKLFRPRISRQNSEHRDNFRGLFDHNQEPVAMEGSREANIMMHSRSAQPNNASEATGDRQSIEYGADDVESFDEAHEQRPTRLFDLDPERQQIPSENVDYLRHLGVSTPNLQREDDMEAGPDAHGWVYLNLLMNMAQLHIMNVTVDFVRDAVEEVSSKFQLSSDGRRLRWRGGAEPTSLSSISGSTTTRGSPGGSESTGGTTDGHACHDEPQAVDVSPEKSDTESKQAVDDYNPRLMRAKKMERERYRHAAYYSPIFSHCSDEIADSSDGLDTSSSEQIAVGHKRKKELDTKFVPPAKKRKLWNDRPRGIVFYNAAPFFLDVGGDVVNSQIGNGVFDFADYNSDRSVLGCESVRCEPDPDSLSLSSQYLATRKYWDRLLIRDSILPSPEPIESPSTDSYFIYNPDPGTDIDAKNVTPLLKFPVQMEASCLGCISPADHFLETVTTEMNISMQAESNSPLPTGPPSTPGSRSNLEFTQNSKKEHDLESRWQRIQARLADLRSQANIKASTSSSPPEKPSRSDKVNKPVHVPPFSSLPTNSESRSIVTRKILGVTYQQLEPSPQPPPGLYFSELSQSTDDDDDSGSGSGSRSNSESRQGHIRIGSRPERISRSRQPPVKPHHNEFGSSWAGNAATSRRPDNIRRPSGETTASSMESSGVGEEEDEEDEDSSIDLLKFAREADPKGTSLIEKEWELERLRELEMDEVSDASLQAVGSSEDSEESEELSLDEGDEEYVEDEVGDGRRESRSSGGYREDSDMSGKGSR